MLTKKTMEMDTCTYTPAIGVSTRIEKPSTLQNGVSRFHSLCSTCALWIYLFVFFSICPSGIVAELCIYERRVYNVFTSGYQPDRTTRECRWGCCEGNHGTPCCNAPIGLIVGSVFGGILLLSLCVIVCCCCFLCRRRQIRNSERRGRGFRFALRTRSEPPNDEVTQESGSIYRTDASGLPEYPGTQHYDPPPSYDDVMRGETNPAFKPDTDTS